MFTSIQIELNPNNKQKTLLKQHCGCARWAYNWGLQECIKINQIRKVEQEEQGKAATPWPSSIDLHKRLVAEVKPLNLWFYKSSKFAPQQALRDLETAFKNMNNVPGKRFPKFKKKGRRGSFQLESTRSPIQISGNKIKLAKIGWIRCKESISEQHEFFSVRISEKAGKWFLAFRIESADPEPTKITSVVGLDLGIKTFATLSNGGRFLMPDQSKLQKKLVRCQRRSSKRISGSGRKERAKRKVAKIFYRISCVRKNATHKLTNHLAKNHGTVVIEDLHVKGMVKNHNLASVLHGVNFGEVRRQLDYKTKKFGSKLVVANRWFPSSQICSCCGSRQKTPLCVRVYLCSSCGFSCDRDENAARNLAASHAVTVRQNPEVHVESDRCRNSCVKESELLIASGS